MNTRIRVMMAPVIAMAAAAAALSADAPEARAQYGPRADPITGARTGGRFMPALPSPFDGGAAAARGVGDGGVSRFGGYYGSGYGYPGVGYGAFGVPGLSSYSVSTRIGGLGFSATGYGVSSYGIGGFGVPASGYWVGYGVPSLYGRYPYGSVGFSTFSYGVPYPYVWYGYGGFPYGYGYGSGGGFFGF
ncbi:hypothetical protein [Tautonia sociabilis]|uniref:Spore coat protein n=1 Tax=Tautonia sociabilis TaxID=2080755 RepID=A0A432MJ14_9BACT|nr:hypothetical protein [Tautonia sociabilis]RUL87220.1 hypothetical protein TsocGM_13420 [Tautonia sociabilis]